jgi:hypothetical protein
MKPIRIVSVFAAALLLTAVCGDGSAPADAAQRPGRVCPDPSRPCPGFKPHDLSFVLPRDGTARPDDRSEPFFAVILRSGPRCSIADEQRRAAQLLFPRNKVFSQRFECDDDVENNITYTNVNASAGFLAVHAGATRESADALLARVRATRRFPGANLRRMQVIRVHP